MKLPGLFCPPLLLTPSLGIHFSKPVPKALLFLRIFKERLRLGSHEVEEQVGFIWGGVIVEFSEEIVFCLCVFLCKHLPHVCVSRVFRCLWGPEAVRFSEAGIRCGCRLSGGMLELLGSYASTLNQ